MKRGSADPRKSFEEMAEKGKKDKETGPGEGKKAMKGAKKMPPAFFGRAKGSRK
jgi:hypothetical protein